MKRLHADDPVRAYRFKRFSLRPSSNHDQDWGIHLLAFIGTESSPRS